jgi:hypothetical protein
MHWIKLAQDKDTQFVSGLVFSVSGYRSRGPGSIPGTIRFSEK